MGLAKRVEGHLEGQLALQAKLWTMVVQSLGEDFSDTLDRRFDVDLATRQLLVFRMEDVPSLPPVTDTRITSVKFRVDLSSVQSSLGLGEAALKALF